MKEKLGHVSNSYDKSWLGMTKVTRLESFLGHNLVRTKAC
jgi:hypothetical protein